MTTDTDKDEHFIFLNAMKHTRPLRHCDYSPPLRHAELDPKTKAYRQANAAALPSATRTPLSIPQTQTPDTVLSFFTTGLSLAQKTALKKGSLPLDLSLDLHGLTTDAALNALDHFFNHARTNQLRCLHIIHGKSDKNARLKNTVCGYLLTQTDILAYHTCPLRLGGTGALLVLLKR